MYFETISKAKKCIENNVREFDVIQTQLHRRHLAIMCAKCNINPKSPKKHFFIKYDVNITHHQSSLIKNFSDCAKYFG